MQRVHCAGSPRDLGRDQGEALRDVIRAATGCESWLGRLAALRAGASVARMAKDLRRHFPHQYEWLEEMARAAGVPSRALLSALARSARGEAEPRAAIAASTADATRLVCGAPRDTVWRTVAPEGRFASVELARPTATAPIAGVNEVGLAVVVMPGSAPAGPGRFAPPPSLFARDCLERFEHVEPALEWCLSRPAAPGGRLLLADAEGTLLGVDASGPRRRSIAPSDGWLAFGLAGGEAPAWMKRRDEVDSEELESSLVAALAAGAPTGAPGLLVDPVGRRLRLAGEDWLAAPVTESG